MNRVNSIKTKLKSHKIDAIFVTSPYNISYLVNLFPSTIEEREYYILITKQNSYLLAPKMFMMAVKEKTKNFIYLEITAKKGLYENILEICKKENIKSVGFEKDNLLHKEFEHLKEVLGNIELTSLEEFVEEERQVKDESEIEKIKKACKLTDDAFSNILAKINKGISEKELAFEIENYIRQNGGQIAFSTIVASGKNGAVPHHISTNQKLKANSFILLDFGAKVNGYCSDMSRTIYFGTPNDREVEIYNAVLEAQQMALQKLKEWKRKDFETSHLHTISESHIESKGFPSFPHSLGHGVGLQVHESPSISKYSERNSLYENMVITIEPAIYEPEIGGVRIEDDVLLTKTGYEILTKSPKELTIIK